MTLLLVILGFLIGVGFILAFSRSTRRLAKQAGQTGIGICAAALGQSSKKQENKEKILVLLRERSAFEQGSGETKRELSNSDIREALGVSPKTVVNYLDELEQEGKVEQVGDIGQGVHYRRKN